MSIPATAPRLSADEIHGIVAHLNACIGILDGDIRNLTAQEISLKSMMVVIKRELEAKLQAMADDSFSPFGNA